MSAITPLEHEALMQLAEARTEVVRLRDIMVRAVCNYGTCITTPHDTHICAEGRRIRAERKVAR